MMRCDSKYRLTAALVVLFLCICSSRVDPCWGKDNHETSETPPLPNIRANRFPSIETRVKLYMSNWYTPPCPGDKDAFVQYSLDNGTTSGSNDDKSNDEWPTLTVEAYKNHPIVNQTMRIMEKVESIIEPDMLFFMDQETVFNCGNYSYDEEWGEETKDPYNERIKFRHNMRMYCEDVQKLLVPAWRHLRMLERSSERKNLPPPPTLIQFGDNKQSHVFKDVNVPHIKKFRSAALSPQDLKDVTPEGCYASTNSKNTNMRQALRSAHGDHRFQPIVWKLASDRHFKKLGDVYRYDTQWSHKKDMAVFRGQLTGSRDGYDKRLSDEENCHNLKRCRLVYNHANSTLIHARLTSTRDRLPDILNGVELLAEKVKIDTLLEYKGIVMIEGNDVASGLKWALLSQSVVLMPKPKHTSWCMEELLEPWVHYVPLDDFATNVEERMQWIIDNDEKARKISETATLWMEDMVFHPDAAEDDRLIQEEILKRYEAHFLKVEE
eukprot:CAMPEP_0116120082 /NCGR_PEP_ID=MMETSP0329-20121206/2990_1 /TAXON_ID=697910 /ORGANISM="Pseudo-nitzschia arenysensis, Strain B593" /LENGTH=493 /DNA_ID=CAMNT_0003613837 /DNA_START=147 /DNA_END=1628 /DNA_ORIENTATION=-